MPPENTEAQSTPPEIRWSEAIAIGVKNVDEQHKYLLGIANKFLRALHAGVGDKILGSIIRELREYTVTHFSDEEDFMRKVGYPHLMEHQREHQNLTAQVKKYQDDIYRKNPLDPLEIRGFIKQWLIGHMIGSDARIAAFMREPGTAAKVAESPKEADEKPQEPGQEQPSVDGDGDKQLKD